jgi:hypothetical protein
MVLRVPIWERSILSSFFLLLLLSILSVLESSAMSVSRFGASLILVGRLGVTILRVIGGAERLGVENVDS